MKIENIMQQGTFIKRLNRFEALVDINGEVELVHVPNTGRCKELFIEGVTVLLEQRNGPHRKTKYELAMVYKGERLISIDSQLPNKLAAEAAGSGRIPEISGYDFIKRESVYGNSRFDLYLERPDSKCFVEVKGVTLENDEIAMFPDAPTERGTKHIYELMAARKEGYRAILLFVIQMKNVRYFTPNTKTDPDFASALAAAEKAGVEIYAYDCHVRESEIIFGQAIPVILP